MTTHPLSMEALGVLRTITCDANRARITSGQLDRSLYEEVNDVLTRLGGTWKGGRTRAHLFPYDPRPLLASVIATGEMPPKNPWAFFPTPPQWVDYVMDFPSFHDIWEGDFVLEPSAGWGALAEGMRKRLAPQQVQIDCCEILSINQRVLRDKGFEIVYDDFLAYRPQKRYRAIVMNPPFSVEHDRLAYITHIRHAWELLADGGSLIAFAPSGYTFRTDRKSYDFLSFVLTYGAWEELPAKSFHESGTDSAITLMTLEKQDQSWRYHPYNGWPTWYCWELVLLADNGPDTFYQAQQHLIEQLDRGILCADPRLPAWSQTQAAIHAYYQQVIVDDRKKAHEHLDIRPQDWPHLEHTFMTQWDDAWNADFQQDQSPGTSEQNAPVVVEAHGTTEHAEGTAVLLNQEGSDDEVTPSLTRESTGAGTLLYSPFLYDGSRSLEPGSQHDEQAHKQSRGCYPVLPWCMETLVGTIWRNIYTGEAKRVHHLETNRFGKLVLYGLPPETPAEKEQASESIGFWSGNRYLVEDWVRIDQQSEETQLRWFGVELAWLSKQMQCCERKSAEYRWDRTNRALMLRVKQDYQRQLHLAESHMYTFAARFHLVIPFEVLNSGRVGSEYVPAQMALL